MIVIEPFTSPYKQGVIDLVLQIQQQEFNIPIQLADQPDLEDIKSFYFRGNGGFWIALENDEVVGTIGILDIGDNEFALRKMFVNERVRGPVNAVGLRLLNEVIRWCKQRNGRSIYLGTVEKLKGAQRFYAKNGFRQIEPGQLPASFPRVHVDSMFYQHIMM